MFRRPQYNVLAARSAEPRRFLQILAGPRQAGKTTLARPDKPALLRRLFVLGCACSSCEERAPPRQPAGAGGVCQAVAAGGETGGGHRRHRTGKVPRLASRCLVLIRRIAKTDFSTPRDAMVLGDDAAALTWKAKTREGPMLRQA